MCWSGDAGVFQLADQLGDTAIVAAGKDLDGLFIIERFDRSREPDRDEVGLHDAREAIDRRAEFDQPVDKAPRAKHFGGEDNAAAAAALRSLSEQALALAAEIDAASTA